MESQFWCFEATGLEPEIKSNFQKFFHKSNESFQCLQLTILPLFVVALFVFVFCFVLLLLLFLIYPRKICGHFLTSMTPASGKTNHAYFTHYVLIQQKHKCGGFLQVWQHQPTGKSLFIMTLHIHFVIIPQKHKCGGFLQVWQHQPTERFLLSEQLWQPPCLWR